MSKGFGSSTFVMVEACFVDLALFSNSQVHGDKVRFQPGSEN
jgi:hypothetical protein